MGLEEVRGPLPDVMVVSGATEALVLMVKGNVMVQPVAGMVGKVTVVKPRIGCPLAWHFVSTLACPATTESPGLLAMKPSVRLLSNLILDPLQEL